MLKSTLFAGAEKRMSDQPAPLQPLLGQLVDGQPLSEQQAFDAFETIMTGQADPAQIGALLTAIACRAGGPTVDELVGAARVMRQHVAPVAVPEGIDVIDTCGTGGDHVGTFNISTTAALIAAGAGATVAKHGNRSVTSKSGSSQVLQALGVELDITPEQHTRCLTEARLSFCFAPAHHPAMKHAIGPRKALGFRTVFNVLGPLTNPAGARRQVIGVYDNALTELLAKVLKRMGAVHAMVVHGKTIASPDTTRGGGGLDEITTTGPTQITVVKNDRVETSELHPGDLGLKIASVSELQIDSIDASAKVVRSVLAGEGGPARDIAALNAAAALVVADLAGDLKEGLDQAYQAIDDGQARGVLQRLVAITNGK
jgi:anthranilate phosphoribosyltransferase